MKKVSRDLACSPQDVFDVLADGWLYASWVVGASRIRDVDAGWPAVGSRIHHSVGSWPLLIDDVTVIKEYDPPRSLRMKAKGWPAGEAEVTVTVAPSPKGCLVTIMEDAIAGPGTLIPVPIRQAMLAWRNTEALRRLEFLAEGRKS